MSKTSVPRISLLALSLCLTGFPIESALAADKAQPSNPISRAASLLNPKLVEVEDRLSWLQGRLRGLAVHAPKPLRAQFGWRSGRTDPHGGDPSITLDLGSSCPVSDVYIVPAQPQPGDTGALFPLRFQIETSLEPTFARPKVIYATGDNPYEVQGGFPLRAPARDLDARYVRLTIQQGHFRGVKDYATISELVVISGGQPVSFAATATAHQSLDGNGSWDPSFAIDGRTPLGVWEGGKWTSSRGELVDVTAAAQQVRWTLDLGKKERVDQVILFPYMLPELAGLGALPADIRVFLTDDHKAPPGDAAITYGGGETTTPLVISLPKSEGRYLIIQADRAVRIGPRHVQALSEIQAWAQGRNLARSQPIHISHAGGKFSSPTELTDGYTNGLQIFSVGQWLRQLFERGQIEKELASKQQSMAAKGEFYTTWGAAVAIGLIFLILLADLIRRSKAKASSSKKLAAAPSTSA